MKKFRHGENGQFIALVAAALIVLGLFVGIAIDGGRAYVLRSRLYKLVDPMALAGALAIVGITDQTDAKDAARDAACDVAKVNGIVAEDCGTANQKVKVKVIAAGQDPDLENNCAAPPCVIVTAIQPMNTSFMALGKLIGCQTCDVINVTAGAVASLQSVSSDIILTLDDTGSMEKGTPKRITKAKVGATKLVNTVLPAVGSSSSTKISLVPFRGCYNTTGDKSCIDSDEVPGGDIVSLTTDNGSLASGINRLNAKGKSGTNVCEALFMTRQKLFEAGKARPNANKFIVLLTDAENHSENTLGPVSPGCDAKDQTLDLQTYNLAEDIKKGLNVGTSGQNAGQTVEIYVIYYGIDSDNPNPPLCDPGTIGSVRDDLNLARCLASTPSHYLPAPSPQAIEDQFNKIIDILKSLRLVG